MPPYLFHGDCRTVLPTVIPDFFHSCVVDPPYEIKIMGRQWDDSGVSFDPAVWAMVLRVMRPGAYLLSFAGPRTYHRIASAIEDAGFEIVNQLMWLYGSGMNKVGYIREAHGDWPGAGGSLKPGHEPIVMARKPLEGTLRENVAKWGTGCVQIDGCRVALQDDADAATFAYNHAVTTRIPADRAGALLGLLEGGWKQAVGDKPTPPGRWPATVLHDGEAGLLEASRFFYCPKARGDRERGVGNDHPSVKPVDLMRYLCRLVTPPAGWVLDPMMGSGSTGVAARQEGLMFLGIEQDATSYEIAKRRTTV